MKFVVLVGLLVLPGCIKLGAEVQMSCMEYAERLQTLSEEICDIEHGKNCRARSLTYWFEVYKNCQKGLTQ